MKYCCFLTLAVLLFSCSDKRVEMIEVYEEMATKVKTGQLEDVATYLDDESLNYFKQMTNPEKMTIEEVVDLGISAQLPYFSVLYLASCGDYIKKSGKPSEFFRFLANNDISFFSKYNSYKVSEEQSKLGQENFVAIYREEGGSNKISWTKFTKTAEGTFKYNLLYNLKLEEKRKRKIYNDQRAAQKDLDMKTFLLELYEKYNIQNCDL